MLTAVFYSGLTCLSSFLCVHMGPVWHCNQLFGEERAGCFVSRWFCKVSVVRRGLFTFPFDAISGLCSVSVAVPGHLLYCSHYC